MNNMTLKGLRMELTDSIKNYTTDKLSHLEKFIPTGAHIAVEIGRPSSHHKSGPDVYQASIEIDSAGQTYYICITDADLYASIDRARDEIAEMIKQGRGKKQALWKQGRAMIKSAMRGEWMGSMKRIPRKAKRALLRQADAD